MQTMTIVQGTLASEERLRWLSDQLAQHGAVSIAEAAQALGVSEMTIRRALAELEERGTARRVRGGARALGPRRFEDRRHTAVRAKAKIAASSSTNAGSKAASPSCAMPISGSAID